MTDFRERVLEGVPGIRKPFLGDRGSVIAGGAGPFERNYVAVWIERDGASFATYYELFRLRHDEQLALEDDDWVRKTITVGCTQIYDEDDAETANKVAKRFVTLQEIPWTFRSPLPPSRTSSPRQSVIREPKHIVRFSDRASSE